MHPRKHHYVPIFYLKQWAGKDGRVVEYSRPYRDVKALRKYPAATGYQIDLYTLDGLPAEKAQTLESDFLRPIDGRAAEALRALICDDDTPWDVEMRSVWSRFLLSLIRRHPNSIRRLAEANRLELDRLGLASSTNTASTSAIFGRLIQSLIDSPNVGGFINGMRWSVVTTNDSNYQFLTADNPVIYTNGIKYPQSHIALPIAPNKLFVCTNTEDAELRLRALPQNELVQQVNSLMAGQAAKYVYGTDDRQLRFVANRLDRRPFVKP